MTLPRLMTVQEDIGGSLAQVADAIGSLLNPNAKFQHAMKLAFAEDPELMQRFVDVEKANPGTLKAFGFGAAGADLLSGMQESIPSIIERGIAPEIAAELGKKDSAARRSAAQRAISGQTPGQLAEDSFSEWFVGEGKKMLEADKELFREYVRARWGTRTELERGLEREALRVYTKVEDLPKDLDKLKTAIRTGGVSNELLSAAAINPRTAFAVNTAIEQLEQERREDIAMAEISARRYGTDTDDVGFRQRQNAAIEAWRASGNVGTPADWYAHMFQSNANELGPPNPENTAAIQEASKQAHVSKLIDKSVRVERAIGPALKRLTAKNLGKKKPEQMQVDINSINKVLELEGSPWRASWEKIPRSYAQDLYGLIFTDGAGNQTQDPGVITDPLSSLGAAPRLRELTAQEQSMVAELRAMNPNERRNWLTRMQQSRPEVAQRIIEELKK